MGYFRRQAQPLWAEMLAWFEEHPPMHQTHQASAASAAA
jgi:hypothetical protein